MEVRCSFDCVFELVSFKCKSGDDRGLALVHVQGRDTTGKHSKVKTERSSRVPRGRERNVS